MNRNVVKTLGKKKTYWNFFRNSLLNKIPINDTVASLLCDGPCGRQKDKLREKEKKRS